MAAACKPRPYDLNGTIEFFQHTLGLPFLATFENAGGHAVLLEAGRATLELFDEAQARAIDFIEVGRPLPGPIRVAFEGPDSESSAAALAARGAEVVGGPVLTPWRD